jgi:phosphonate transport system ATP-binding protein
MGFWLSVRSLFHPYDIPAVRAALAPFGLEARLFDRVDRLSGGERQRVGLARALLAPARIWLLDEPLGALDPTHAAEVLDVLRVEAARRGVTLVMAMHQVDLAQAHFPRLVGMRGGRVAFDQAADSLAPQQWHALYDVRSDPAAGTAYSGSVPAGTPGGDSLGV